jgi:hypothetical protein
MIIRFPFAGAILLVSGLCLAPFPAFALQQPTAGSRDACVRTVVYDPINVTAVRLRIKQIQLVS